MDTDSLNEMDYTSICTNSYTNSLKQYVTESPREATPPPTPKRNSDTVSLNCMNYASNIYSNALKDYVTATEATRETTPPPTPKRNCDTESLNIVNYASNIYTKSYTNSLKMYITESPEASPQPTPKRNSDTESVNDVESVHKVYINILKDFVAVRETAKEPTPPPTPEAEPGTVLFYTTDVSCCL